MRKLFVLCAFLAAVSRPAAAADVALTSVAYPDGTTVDLRLAATKAAPDARVEASVRYKDGQAAVDVSWKKLEPALLFGGDIAAYVVWAVSPDGSAENLGEIAAADTGGSARFQTRRKDFGLMVTAEPLAAVPRPSTLVVFTSGAPDSKSVKASPLTFSGFVTRSDVKVDQQSIAGLSYSGKEPVVVVQARRAVALAERSGAGEVKPELLAAAKTAVAQANNSLTAGGSARAGADASRKAVELSWQALAATYARKEAAASAATAAAKAAAEAKTAAEKAAFEQKTAAEKASLQQSVATTSAALGESETKRREAEAAIAAATAEREKLSAELASATAERQALAAEKTRIQGQRDTLMNQLNTALGRMATATKSERGQIVSLAGTAFPSGKATLTTDAKYTLAKLAGVLMAAPEVNLSIEGHTDSTGVAGKNDKLSGDRAGAVKVFLSEMGVEPARMKSAGYGSRVPVAPNDTNEGRAKNRRVDIVLGAGDIPAPAVEAAGGAPAKNP